jgi:hypothetical protein
MTAHPLLHGPTPNPAQSTEKLFHASAGGQSLCFAPVWKFPKTPPDPIEKIRFKVGTMLVARIGVCVPFAPFASFALNGSVDFDSFALGFPILFVSFV